MEGGHEPARSRRASREESLRWEQVPAETQVTVQEVLKLLLLEVMEFEAASAEEEVEDV